MSSPNVFAEAWSNWIHVGVTFAGALGLLYLTVWVGGRMRAKGWRVGLLAVLGFGAGLVGGILFPWPIYIGRYEHLYWLRIKDREILAVLTQYARGGRAGYNRFHYLSTFDLRTGEPLGRSRLPDRRLSGPNVEIRGARGTEAYLTSPEGYLVVDLATGAIVAREKERRGGIGPYQRRGFEEERWAVSVLLQDGRTAAIPMGPRPTQHSTFARIDPDGTWCGTWTRQPGAGTRIAGLLRAVPIRSTASRCRFPSGVDSVQLYLHRATAFGEGPTLLSALTDAGVRKWTLDLSARCDVGGRYEVLAVETAGKALRVLVGTAETIFWFVVEPGTGAVVGERALY